MQAFVIVNPAAGAAERQGRDAAAGRIAAALDAQGIGASIVTAPGPEIADRLRPIAAPSRRPGREFDAVVVAGGDGSVNAAARVLAGGDLPLGVLPLGTFNHFARDLGLPLDIDAAARVIAQRRIRRVDVGEVNGRVFVNNSSLGLYPNLVAERERARRRGVAKWAALAVGLLRVLWSLPAPRVRVEAAGWRGPRRTPCLFVGNNFYDLDQLGAAERRRLDGGELCLYATARQSRLALFALACRAALGRLETARNFVLARGTQFRVTAPRRLRVALDGNLLVLTPPLEYRIRPAALPVFVPAGSG